MPDLDWSDDPVVAPILNDRADHLLDYDHLAELLELDGTGGDVLVDLCGRLTSYPLTVFQQGIATGFVVRFALAVLAFNATEGRWETPYG